MKKGSAYTILGILLLVVSLVANTVISKNYLDFSDVTLFGVWHYVTITAVMGCLIAGVVLTVIGKRKLRKDLEQQKFIN